MRTWELTFPFVNDAENMDALMTQATALLVDSLDGQDLDPTKVEWGPLRVGKRDGELRFVVDVTLRDDEDAPCPLCGGRGVLVV